MADSPLPRTAHFRDVDASEQRSTFLELFFDLVFVFAVTQLSQTLFHDLTLHGLLKTTMLLLVVWWAWIYTTWMANWFDPASVAVRCTLIVVMLFSLLMAIAIPSAFSTYSWLFAGSYVLLQTIRNVFIVLASPRGHGLRVVYGRICAWFAWVSIIWLLGAAAPVDARPWIWLVALALDYLGPFAGYWTPGLGRSDTEEWYIEGSHFAERFQLFIIIALGESIVVTGATASSHALTPASVTALVVAFLGSAALWWLYFDFVAELSAARLRIAPDRGRLARDAFTYLHIPIVAGIVASAVGDEVLITHPTSDLAWAAAAVTIGGPMLYLLGHNLFRVRMAGSWDRQRLGAMFALLACGLAVPFASAIVVNALVVSILMALVAIETVRVRQQRLLERADSIVRHLEAR